MSDLDLIFDISEFENALHELPDLVEKAEKGRALELGAEYILTGVKANILKNGLLKTGALFESIYADKPYVDSNEAYIEFGSHGIIYAAIHEFGGMINHPGSHKLQVFEIDGKTIFTMSTRPHEIFIPARPYLRPALDERSDGAMQIMEASINEALSEAWYK